MNFKIPPTDYCRRFSKSGDVSSVSIGATNEPTFALPVEPETHVSRVSVKVFGRCLKPLLIQSTLDSTWFTDASMLEYFSDLYLNYVCQVDLKVSSVAF